MTSTVDNPEQTIMKVLAPPVAYALCTFEIDIENWSLLPVVSADRSGWDEAYSFHVCEPAGHVEPYGGCHCGVYGYHSLDKLRAAHRQAATLVAVMKYDPSPAAEQFDEVRAPAATIVAYWISPDLPLHGLASAVVRDLTGQLCIEYDDLACMLARYKITERWDEVREVSATDGVAPVPRWVGALGMSRAVVTARALRSWIAVVGRPLRESFSDAWVYATRTAWMIAETMFIAWCAVGLHHVIRTQDTPFAWLDPVLLAGHALIRAIDTPPVLLTLMCALAVIAAVDAVRRARPLPRLTDPVGWIMTVVLPFIYGFAQNTVLALGTVVVLASANGHPEPGGLAWSLAAMFGLIIVARSVTPFAVICGRLRAVRAQPTSWGQADV